MRLTKNEQSNRYPKTCEDCGHESMLLRPQSSLEDIRYEVEPQRGEVDSHRKDASHDDRQKDDRHLTDAEPVYLQIHQRKDLEEGVVDAVCQRGVDVDEEESRVFDADFQRLDESIEEFCGELGALAIDLGLRVDIRIASQCAQTGRSMEKDGGRLRFWQEEEKEEEDRGGHPEEFPLRPEHGSSQHRANGKAGSTKRKDVPSPILRIDGEAR